MNTLPEIWRPMVGLGLALVLIPGITACTSQDESGHARGSVRMTAETRTLAPIELPSLYHTSGVVSSDHRVAVSSRLSGYIRAITVREGDSVRRGQLLVRVDPVDARQAYNQAKADLINAETDLKRYQGLLAEHAVSQQQFDRIKLRYTVARSRLAQAENQLRYAEVHAPVDGIVVEKRASRGDLASPAQPLLILEDPSSLLVETHVSEQFIAAIHEGDRVRISLPGIGKNMDARVRQIVRAADALSHQFLIKLSIAPESGAYPGMFAEVHFVVGSYQAIVVPEVALVQRSGLTGVYVLDRHRIAHYRQVRLGQHHADGVEVLAGLKAGDVIAWRRDGALRTGILVPKE